MCVGLLSNHLSETCHYLLTVMVCVCVALVCVQRPTCRRHKITGNQSNSKKVIKHVTTTTSTVL
jgi:hypothetical protein